MYNLVLKINTQTASFRIPEFQNFHKSYFLPPPTTIIGLAGAALKLSPKNAQDFFSTMEFMIGVYGKAGGITRDLWKYNTFDSQGSIIKREILFHNLFYIVYSFLKESAFDEVCAAFKNPGYALTLGSSDSIAKISFVNEVQETESNEIENCIVEGDIINNVLNNINDGLTFSIYSTSDPMSFDVPIKFHYDSHSGVRRVVKRKQYSFIGNKMILNMSLKGIKTDNVFIPLIKVN